MRYILFATVFLIVIAVQLTEAQTKSDIAKMLANHEQWTKQLSEDLNDQITNGGHCESNVFKLKNKSQILDFQADSSGVKEKLDTLLERIHLSGEIQYMIEWSSSGERIFYNVGFKTSADSLYVYSLSSGVFNLVKIKKVNANIQYKLNFKSCDAGFDESGFVVTFFKNSAMLVKGYFFSCDKDYQSIIKMLY